MSRPTTARGYRIEPTQNGKWCVWQAGENAPIHIGPDPLECREWLKNRLNTLEADRREVRNRALHEAVLRS